MITVFINGQATQLPTGTTLAEVVQRLQEEAGQAPNPSALATAVNEEFIARSARADHALNDNDQITTFSPITGG